MVKRHDDNSAINTSTAKDADGPGLVRRAGFPGYAVDHSERNVVEYLLEDDYVAAGWCCVIHNTLPSGRIFDLTPARFHPPDRNACGMTVIRFDTTYPVRVLLLAA